MRFIVASVAAFFVLVQSSALRIVVIEGEGAVNIIQQKTAVAPIVEVRDQNNVPVAGAVVRFTIAGGKQATFAGGTQTITVTTNAAGRAAAAAINPLSNGAMQIQVQATFQGQTAAATIAQTNVMTAAGGGIGGGTIAGIAGGVAAAGAATVLAQKSDEGNDETDGTNSRTIDPAIQAALGTYVLQTVNGAGLPAVTVSSPPATCEVITDNATLSLTADGSAQRYEVVESSRTNCRLGPSSTFQSSSTGTWTLSGGTVTFAALAANWVLDAAALSGSTLTMTAQAPHIDAGREAPRINTVWRK